METRDLLLLIGFLRGGRMYPRALPQPKLPAERSLRIMMDAIANEERALFPDSVPSPPARSPSYLDFTNDSRPGPASSSRNDIRQRAAVTAWSGDFMAWTTPVGDVPDPGVVLCLLYDGPAAEAALPIDVFAQTLRRYTLRDPALRGLFEHHVDEAGTFVPPSLSPELRRRRSQDSFEGAMRVAREQGFSAAVPLFEGVRGDCFASAQIAIAVHELRELGDVESALSRLDEVIRLSPRNVAARMQRAQILMGDAGRRVEAATDWLSVLREVARPDGAEAPAEVRDEAKKGLWALHREFANARKLEGAAALAKQDPERGFEAVSRYVHTHPCSWDGQLMLASLALARQSFDLTIKLLTGVRWLYPDDPTPHFVYGQALASKGTFEAAVQALEHAARLAPGDTDITHWLAFAREKLPAAQGGPEAAGVKVAHHVARTLLLLVGFVRGGRVYPAALPLHRVPGDVSLTLVVQALAAQEQRRFGDPYDRPPASMEPRYDGAASGPKPQAPAEPPSSGAPHARGEDDIDLRAVSERTVLLTEAGLPISVDQLVGDVPDPGVLYALLYDSVTRDAQGRRMFTPPPSNCRGTIALVARADVEMIAKVERHMSSPEATLMARLDLSQS